MRRRCTNAQRDNNVDRADWAVQATLELNVELTRREPETAAKTRSLTLDFPLVQCSLRRTVVR